MYVGYCRARVAELAGRRSEAESGYQKAADAFAAAGFPKGIWRALALLDSGELLLAEGRTTEAAAQLAAVVEVLGPQIGRRGARIARLREELARKGVRTGSRSS